MGETCQQIHATLTPEPKTTIMAEDPKANAVWGKIHRASNLLLPGRTLHAQRQAWQTNGGPQLVNLAREFCQNNLISISQLRWATQTRIVSTFWSRSCVILQWYQYVFITFFSCHVLENSGENRMIQQTSAKNWMEFDELDGNFLGETFTPWKIEFVRSFSYSIARFLGSTLIFQGVP